MDQDSKIPTYQKMWKYMDHNRHVFVKKYEHGVQRVLEGRPNQKRSLLLRLPIRCLFTFDSFSFFFVFFLKKAITRSWWNRQCWITWCNVIVIWRKWADCSIQRATESPLRWVSYLSSFGVKTFLLFDMQKRRHCNDRTPSGATIDDIPNKSNLIENANAKKTIAVVKKSFHAFCLKFDRKRLPRKVICLLTRQWSSCVSPAVEPLDVLANAWTTPSVDGALIMQIHAQIESQMRI